jgi:hypothetical protein
MHPQQGASEAFELTVQPSVVTLAGFSACSSLGQQSNAYICQDVSWARERCLRTLASKQVEKN